MLFILILLFALQISNYFIKSSMHTAFNVFVAALFFALHIKVGFIWLGIAVLVGVTRVILKRHTPQEVLMGAAIAFVVSFIYLYCNIQFNSEI
jgi:membrane-associated phospholipid phosphatase